MLLPFAKRTAREIGQRLREGTNPGSPQPGGWLNLTDTERIVAHLAAQGLTSRAVADRMLPSQQTVRLHPGGSGMAGLRERAATGHPAGHRKRPAIRRTQAD
jgi:hypothetical protein